VFNLVAMAGYGLVIAIGVAAVIVGAVFSSWSALAPATSAWCIGCSRKAPWG
jgi:hypothetical protein